MLETCKRKFSAKNSIYIKSYNYPAAVNTGTYVGLNFVECLASAQVTKDSSGLPVVHHSKYVCHIPANHKFPMRKFPKILLFLLRDQITDKQLRQ